MSITEASVIVVAVASVANLGVQVFRAWIEWKRW